MGGETIADALAAAPWICSDAVSLVLQPVTSAAELRRFLAESGFALREELPVIDGRYCYTVLRAVWTGEKVSPGPLFCELGLLRGQRSPAAAACMVLYESYQTAYVTPEEAVLARLGASPKAREQGG